MSIHKSLATRGSLVRSRNVLNRYERILELTKSGKWSDEEDSPFGLPKVRVSRVKKRGKEKKKKEETAAAPGVAGAAAAAPAGGAAPAAATDAKTARAAKGAAKK